MNKKLFPIGVVTLALFFAVTTALLAATPCSIIYGGGQKSDGSPYCMEAMTTMQSTPTQTPSQNGTPLGNVQNQTKGGYAVQTPPPMTQSPSTGPEMFSFLALLPAGVAGLYLRRKSA